MSSSKGPSSSLGTGALIAGLGILIAGLGIGGVLLFQSRLSDGGAPAPTAAPAIRSAPTPLPSDTPTSPATPSPAPSDTPTAIPTVTLDTSNIFIEYILDASGSMTETLSDGSPKIDVAKRLLTEHMRSFRPETNIGLRAYGHRLPYQPTAESCQDIELVAPVEKGQMERIVGFLQNFEAQGMTPLAASLGQAKEDFTFEAPRVNSIVMLSDGIETCGGDPCQLVEDLKAEGINFTIHVIGLDVDNPTREQLSCIAQVGGGTYHDARNQQDLGSALDAVKTDVTKDEVVVPPGADTPTPVPVTPTSLPSSLAGKIVFLSSRDYSELRPGASSSMSPHNIYVMNADGSEQKPLTSGARFSNLDRLVVSPDGRQIAIADDTDHVINILDQVGALVSTIAYPTSSTVVHGWSPDGKILLTVNGPEPIDEELYLLDVQTEVFTRLTEGDYWALYAAFSPDGRQIAFGRDSTASLQSAQLWLMNNDGGDQRLLFERNAYGMSWSPDGEWIAFESYSTGADAQYDIWLVRADGSDARNFTQGRYGFPFGPQWSSDSKQIVFADQGRGGSDGAQIFVADVDTGNAIQLTTLGNNYAPFWVASD